MPRGNPYDIRLRGDVSDIVRGMGAASSAVGGFARLIGPGGFAFGAVKGFASVLSLQMVTATAAAALGYRGLTAAVRATTAAYREQIAVERGLIAVENTRMGQLQRRQAFQRGVGDRGGAFATGVQMWAQRQIAQAGSEWSWLTDNIGFLSPSIIGAGAKGAGSWLLGGLGDALDPGNLVGGVRTLWDRPDDLGFWESREDYEARKAEETRRRRARNAVDELVRGEYGGYRYQGRPIGEVLAGRGAFDPDLAGFRMGLSMAGSADLAAHGGGFAAARQARIDEMLSAGRAVANTGAFRLGIGGAGDPEAVRAAQREQWGHTLKEMRDMAAALGTTRQAVNRMGGAALAAALNLDQIGPPTDATRLAALEVRRNELLAAAEASGGATLAGTRQIVGRKPGTGEPIYGPWTPSAAQAELNLIDAQIAALTPAGAQTGGAVTAPALPPPPHFFSTGTAPQRSAAPGTDTLMNVARDEDAAARGVRWDDRVLG